MSTLTEKQATIVSTHSNESHIYIFFDIYVSLFGNLKQNKIPANRLEKERHAIVDDLLRALSWTTGTHFSASGIAKKPLQHKRVTRSSTQRSSLTESKATAFLVFCV